MRISDWSADVCSSDLAYFVDVAGDERLRFHRFGMSAAINERRALQRLAVEDRKGVGAGKQIELLPPVNPAIRSEEHTSELQSLMRISYAVFCLKKKNTNIRNIYNSTEHHKRIHKP